MKGLSKIIAAMAVVIMCVAFAGCGGSSGYSKGEQFQLGENTYALEKVVKAVDKDTSSTECYGVSLLQVGNSAPVIISGFGSGGAMSTQSAIELTLTDGDATYSPSTISFEATDEVEGYGSRIVFYFDLPAGTAVPTKGILKGTSDEETAELDLSGMTPETDTTTTTTTTTPVSDIPVAPDAGNENYDGIGNTDVYDGIGDTDIFNADDTIQDDIAQPGL